MADARTAGMTIVLVCPDGLSILLFCKGIIRSLRSVPGARVVVACDEGPYRTQIQELGVTSVHVPYERWMNPLKDLKYLWRLARLFRREQCDLVLNFSTKSNIFGTFAARMAGTRLVLSHIVGLGAAFQAREDFGGRFVRLVVFRLYRLTCAWSHKVWFTNTNDRQYFIDHGLVSEEKAVLTRNYLDVSEYGPGTVSVNSMAAAREACDIAPGDQVVVMVARLIWAKGIREYAEAAERLRESHPHVKFLLIAPLETGSSDAVPEQYVREKEQSANFRWLGFQQDVKRLYAIADLAVLPTFYKEGGYPRALLEPMSMGKPVITTDSPDCRDTVEDGRNGFLVPVRNAEALAAAIVRILDDPDLREAFGQYSYQKARLEFDEGPILAHAFRQMGVTIASPPPATT